MLPELLGRLVAGQLMDYMSTASLHPPIQSGLRPGYSTETAVLRALSDILLAVDRGDLTALILLDLTAAFDTVDHDILLQRLKMSLGFTDVALQWLQLYLVGRSQYVRREHAKSAIAALMCGVPQSQSWAPYCSLCTLQT